jgi:hypothetical protein
MDFMWWQTTVQGLEAATCLPGILKLATQGCILTACETSLSKQSTIFYASNAA